MAAISGSFRHPLAWIPRGAGYPTQGIGDHSSLREYQTSGAGSLSRPEATFVTRLQPTPHKPLVSYRINRQLSGWIPPRFRPFGHYTVLKKRLMVTVADDLTEIYPMNTSSRSRSPTTVKGTVGRGRLPNAHYRTREYLTQKEVERLMKAASNNRHGHRDTTMILLAFRHGLRASDLCSLRLSWRPRLRPRAGFDPSGGSPTGPFF